MLLTREHRTACREITRCDRGIRLVGAPAAGLKHVANPKRDAPEDVEWNCIVWLFQRILAERRNQDEHGEGQDLQQQILSLMPFEPLSVAVSGEPRPKH